MTELISICIPTFNRSLLLTEALNSIEINTAGRTDVEVVISDNGSQDNTEAVVDGFRNRIPNLRYYRNSENIGPVKNLRKVVEHARGEYVWMLADDDVIVEGALSILTGFLTQNPDVMYLFYSREVVDYDLNPTPQGKQPHGLQTDLIFSNGNDLFCACDGQMPYIIGFFSSTIIQRQLWMENVTQVKAVSDSFAWDHLSIILRAIREKRCAILSTVGVKARLNYRPVKASSKVGFDDSIRFLKDTGKMGYDLQQINKTMIKVVQSESKSFVVDKAKGLRGDNIFQFMADQKLLRFARYSSFWGILSVFPAGLLKQLFRFYSAVKDNKKKSISSNGQDPIY
ncbi:glycosyltransferase [bacterium]|nr:glycosyltransferase [bacterium]